MVDNQHKKIETYRDLTEGEIALINLVKAHEKRSAALLRKITKAIDPNQRDMAMSRTAFEDGCIRLVRAIAKPETPFD